MGNKKLAVITINNPDVNMALQIQQCCAAVIGAKEQQGGFFANKWDDVEIVVVSVVDNLTIRQLKENAEKFGLKTFLQKSIEQDTRYEVLVIGPDTGERLNKISPNLRLFTPLH
ncbi:MAG: hypothetical protein HY514_05235 [Candidatus Aenigmarchaeota archaeon]|nr:hypothetical protein [Candidatus Aenigmarchaeota archaeon]